VRDSAHEPLALAETVLRALNQRPVREPTDH
jgi:hypothetical protein